MSPLITSAIEMHNGAPFVPRLLYPRVVRYWFLISIILIALHFSEVSVSAQKHSNFLLLILCGAFPAEADLYLFGNGTNQVQRLTFDREIEAQPHWSPNGRWYSYVRNRNTLAAVALDGTEIRETSVDIGDILYHVWSPDDRQIAYIHENPDLSFRDTILIWNLETYETRVIEQGHNLSHLAWSPDGMWIAFSSNLDSISRVHVESGVVEVLAQGAAAVFAPSWNQDGTAIAYVDEDTFKINHAILYDLDVVSGNVQNRLQGNSIQYPTWSPDGDLIAASFRAANESLGYRIAIVDENGILTRVEEPNSAHYQPRFISNTEIIFVSLGQLFQANVRTGTSEALVNLDCDIGPFDVFISRPGSPQR